MGKLGKKARKFSKKNLQSVERRNRKLKSTFKKRGPKRNEKDSGQELKKKDAVELSNGRNTEVEYIDNTPLDAIFHEDDSDAFGDESDSDGYLSEVSSEMHLADNEIENSQEGILDGSSGALSIQNEEIQTELVKKTKKLDKLKEKDPEFANFLESHQKEREQFRNKDYADEDEDGMSDDNMQPENVDGVNFNWGKLLSSSSVDSFCQLVTEQQNVSALTCLLNGYRAACHYGAESTKVYDAYSGHRIQNSETRSKILMFILNEANTTLRGLMGIPSLDSRKEKSVDLKKNTKWSTFKPLIKSYLRSTLFLLNQVDDSEILTFSLARIRASMTFFTAFPSLLRRLIKIAVHLWATGRGTVSSQSFLIIRDVASLFRSDYFDTCFVKTYKSYLGHCQFVEPSLFQHIQFLRSSIIDLCSIDVQKASSKALVCIQQLSKIMQQGLHTKKKEAVKKICSWQYTSCIDLWVMFISANIQDYDLQQSLFVIIQIINGMAVLFSGPRYLPLRIKCIQWLNHLSSSSGTFIPVASFVLDILEYKISKDGAKPGKAFNHISSVKLPKHWLKSRNFREQCVLSAIELLSAHFAQWSHHISFPDLATIPLICLKKFHDITTIESSKRVVKRFIDQVEQNIEFVRKKRDEAAFSPTDQQSAELFLQIEKQNGSTPFTQYYKSIMDKATSRNFTLNEKRFTVPQKFFCHFYVLAVVWTTLLLATTWTYAYKMVPLNADPFLYSTFANRITGGSHILSWRKSPSIPIGYRYSVWRSVFLLLLMEVQVVKRLIETIFVFKYSSTARMHIFGYLTGLFFYTAAPLSLCCNHIPEVYNYSVNGVAEFIVKGKKYTMQDLDFNWLEFTSSLLKLGWLQWIGAAIFFWGWIHQRRCHDILGSLREDSEQSDEYVIPHGDWFKFVSSPHYLAEIVIYAGLVVASGGADLTIWLLFGFVVSNLVFAAAETHRWYLQKFRSYPRNRRAIIPFLY